MSATSGFPLPSASSPALALFSKILGAGSFESAVQVFVHAVVGDLGAERAAFGLHHRGRTKLLALSDRPTVDATADVERAVVGAMDEAIEQCQTLGYPYPEDTGASRTLRPIDLEQRALHTLTGHGIATVPLGADGAIFGAVCIELHRDRTMDSVALARMESLLALAGAALRWMHAASMPWHRRLASARHDWVARLRQPENHFSRMAWGTVIACGVLLAVVPFERSVSGRARIEGAQQHILSAPSDGFIGAAHVRPGDRVQKGASLVDLVDQDLQLERERWTSQLAQHENAYAASMAKSDRVAASVSFSRMAEAQAQLALIDSERERGRISSPVEGLIVQGDMTQSIGAPVRQGDPLLTVATTDRFRVIVEVDEIDIGRVKAGQVGRVGVSSLPWESYDVRVERITPMSRTVDGRNVFEVEARPTVPVPGLRPGLLGSADIVVGRIPPLWSWSRHLADRMRIAYWKWLA